MGSSNGILFVWALVLAEFVGWSVGFSVAPRSLILIQPSSLASTSLLRESLHSEFSLVDEGNTESPRSDVPSSDFAIVNQNTESSEDAETPESSSSKRPEYGAMSPGTVVQVQIGDLSLARKAWKKRRRTGSPILVPCSVLSADQRSMVRWNMIFLLEKFGTARADGIQITASELSKKYRNFLRSSMQVRTDLR
jgi:hypothetical protein